MTSLTFTKSAPLPPPPPHFNTVEPLLINGLGSGAFFINLEGLLKERGSNIGPGPDFGLEIFINSEGLPIERGLVKRISIVHKTPTHHHPQHHHHILPRRTYHIHSAWWFNPQPKTCIWKLITWNYYRPCHPSIHMLQNSPSSKTSHLYYLCHTQSSEAGAKQLVHMYLGDGVVVIQQGTMYRLTRRPLLRQLVTHPIMLHQPLPQQSLYQ